MQFLSYNSTPKCPWSGTYTQLRKNNYLRNGNASGLLPPSLTIPSFHSSPHRKKILFRCPNVSQVPPQKWSSYLEFGYFDLSALQAPPPQNGLPPKKLFQNIFQTILSVYFFFLVQNFFVQLVKFL